MIITYHSEQPTVGVQTDLGIVPIMNGHMEINREEALHIKKTLQRIWGILCESTGISDFHGLIRFDLVPSVSNTTVSTGSITFDVCTDGIYEINGNAPECAAFYALMHTMCPDLFPDVSMIRPIAEEIRKLGTNVVFVPGNNPVRQLVEQAYKDFLASSGLNVLCMKDCPSPAQEGVVTFRFGDFWDDFHNQFNPPEELYIAQVRESGATCFNSLDRNRLFDKSQLRALWDDEHLRTLFGDPPAPHTNSDSMKIALSHRQSFVLKPDCGCSGNGIVFGMCCTDAEWRKFLYDSMGKGYSFWKIKTLPTIPIGNMDCVIDMNVSCLANGKNLRPLYLLSRFKEAKAYRKQPMVNVAQKGGIIPFVCFPEA